MSTGYDSLAQDAQGALAALQRLLEDDSKEMIEQVPDAVRRLVRLRDDLIACRRSGGAAPRDSDWLPRVNAILSCVIAAEFPIKGIHRERIAIAHAALQQLLARS